MFAGLAQADPSFRWQRLAFTAIDLKERITGHTEFPFDDRRGANAHEAEEIAAELGLGFHPARGIYDDIGDQLRERAWEADLRARSRFWKRRQA